MVVSAVAVVGHAAVVVLVLLGAAGQVIRPLAPDLGGAPDPELWFAPGYVEQAVAYRRPLQLVGLLALAVRLGVPCIVAFTEPGRRLTGRLVGRVGEHRPARAAGVTVVAVLVGVEVVLLPAAFWAGFVHEGAFGFRTQGLAGWAYDWAATRIPTWAVVGGLVVVSYALVRRLPRAWPPVVAVLGSGVAALLVFLSPVVLEPLVLRTSPLPEGDTRQEVEAVLARAEEDIDRILVADASRRTTKRNAYISGLGASRRVVLYDTLVAGHTPEEVGLVLAHELGHHQNRDLARGTLLAAAGVAVAVYLLAWIMRWRTRTGRQRSQTDPRAATVGLAIVALLSTASLPLQGLVSRRAEAAADFTALRLTDDPATYLSATEGLARANLAEPLEPAWVRLLWSTHPPVVSRLEMGRRWPAEGAR